MRYSRILLIFFIEFINPRSVSACVPEAFALSTSLLLRWPKKPNRAMIVECTAPKVGCGAYLGGFFFCDIVIHSKTLDFMDEKNILIIYGFLGPSLQPLFC